MSMELGVISCANAVILGLMMIPNILYAIRAEAGAAAGKPILNFLEQAGRYASMVLMVFPLGVGEFGFPNVEALLTYFFGNGILTAAYLLTWIFYFRKKNYAETMILAIIPVLIFVLTGVCLQHWLLVAAGVLFGICHISVSVGAFKEKSPDS